MTGYELAKRAIKFFNPERVPFDSSGRVSLQDCVRIVALPYVPTAGKDEWVAFERNRANILVL